MKLALLILFFIPLFGTAQKLVLIDRKFQQPIAMVDAVSVDELTNGIVPFYQEDISNIVELMQRLAKSIGNRAVPAASSFDVSMGNSKCIVKAEKTGNQYTYNIVLNTSMQNFKTSILLVDHEANKRAAQRLNIFIDYLLNNTAGLNDRM